MLTPEDLVIEQLEGILKQLMCPSLSIKSLQDTKNQFQRIMITIKESQSQQQSTETTSLLPSKNNKKIDNLIKSIQDKFKLLQFVLENKKEKNNSHTTITRSQLELTSKVVPNTSCINQLPADILRMIFTYFDLSELARLNQICKRWHQLINAMEVTVTPFIAEIASQTLIINLPDKAKTYQKGSEQVKQFVLENEKQFVDTLKETSHAITDEQARTCWMNTRSALWILICLACLFSVIYTGYQAIQKENHRPVDIILCASMSALTMAAAIKAYTTCTHDRFSWTNFGSQFISIFKDKEIDNEARSYFAKFRHTPNNKSVNGVNYQEENESGNKLSDPQVDSINTENNKDDLYLERTIQSKKSSAAV